jgi:hypothetical protein
MRSGLRVVLTLLLLGSPLLLSSGNASDIPEWPHEREQRLEAVESEILDVQRKLFAARMNNDEAKRKELEKRMDELEREEVKLLRASGKFPPR